MDITKVEATMTGLGFSPYEARAYAALVKEYPLTGYELSGRSGIPRSKIYECIERLSRKKLIIAVDGNPVRYVPVPPDEMTRRLSSEFESSVTELKTLLEENDDNEPIDYIFNISGYTNIIEKAASMIRSADNHLELSLWSDEIELLLTDITAAAERKVHLQILAFDSKDIENIRVYHHKHLRDNKFSGRWLTVVKDRKESLTGQCSGEGGSIAAWTQNKCLVFMSMKYIEHEIIKIVERSDVE